MLRRLLLAGVAATVLLAQHVAPRDDRAHPIIVSSRIAVRAFVDDPGVFKIGRPVILHLVVRVLGPKPVLILRSIPEDDFEIAVADSSGKEPPRTAFGEKALRRAWSIISGDTGSFEAGREVPWMIDLSKSYNLTQPGAYYVRAVFRNVPPDKDSPQPPGDAPVPIEKAYSNTVQFMLEP